MAHFTIRERNDAWNINKAAFYSLTEFYYSISVVPMSRSRGAHKMSILMASFPNSRKKLSYKGFLQSYNFLAISQTTSSVRLYPQYNIIGKACCA
jgi:hypothetical protein